MPLELKLRMRYLKFIIHLCSLISHTTRILLRENGAVRKFFASEFSIHAFSPRCEFSPRAFSRRELPLYIFFSSTRIVSASQISRYVLSVSLSPSGHVSAFFVVHFLVTNFLSSCIFPSYLSTHFSPNGPFFYRGFSRYTPVYFPCFLTRTLLHVFHHPLLHHGFFLAARFPVAISSYFFVAYFCRRNHFYC